MQQNQQVEKEKKLASKGLTIKQSQLIFVSIALIVPIANWLVFYLYTHVSSIFMAFQDMTGKWSMINFVNFYKDLVSPKGEFFPALWNTLKYFIHDRLVLFPSGVIVCFFIYKKVAGYRWFRVIFYLPNIISSVVIIGVFKKLIAHDGLICALLESLGVEYPAGGFLGNTKTATDTILWYKTYVGLAGSFLIISGAMARIPVEVLESARLDGVGPGKELTSMIIPLIWPTLSTLTILAFTGIMSASGPILLMTGGNYGTNTVSFYLFKNVWGGGLGAQTTTNYNFVSAIGLCLTVVVVPFVLFVRWLAEKVPTVEY
ncbi:MAG: sugar ABC transporter permease [Clostridia bacterium]|nr:sugar ABC transporter permease [Clostridia bacterium]